MDTSGLAGCYAPLANGRLRRQRSFPAAVAAAFAPCAGGGDADARRKLGSARLGGMVVHRDDHDGEEQVESSGRVPASWPGPGGAGFMFMRALWIQIVGKVISRSRSSSKKKQYGHEDYACNFDEGDAAGEPDHLPRSFSARYARRRPLGLAIPHPVSG